MMALEDSMDISTPSKRHEIVLLIHGLGANRLMMSPLATRLRSRGFRTENWGYRSLTRDVTFHADRLWETMAKLDADEHIRCFHVVAHSLGGIVTRQALLENRPQKLRRIVMLAPPNRGSRAAAVLHPLVGWLSQAFEDLSDHPDSWVNRLPPTLADMAEVGVVIAGNDLVVPPENTELPGVRDKVTIPGMHAGILWKSATADAVTRFIRFGEFQSK